jgi:hypothetical protein
VCDSTDPAARNHCCCCWRLSLNCGYQRACFFITHVTLVWRTTVEWYWQGNTEQLWEKLTQCHKSYIDWPGRNPGLRGERPATNSLSYSTASSSSFSRPCLVRLISTTLNFPDIWFQRVLYPW